MLTSTFRCEGGNVIDAVKIENRGDTTAISVVLTQAQLTSPAVNGTPLPQSYGNIGPGLSVTRDVGFGSYPPGSQVLKLKGTYAGTLQFSATQLVQIPNCAVVQNTLDMRNGTWASFGPRLDWLAFHEDQNPLSFLANADNEVTSSVTNGVPTSSEWLVAFDWNLSEADLLLYWLTTDIYFQRSPQQSSPLPVDYVTPWVSRISNNGSNEGVGR